MLVRDIIRATALVGGLTVPALLSIDRRKNVARLRQAGVLVSTRLTRQSLPAIGKHWGGRDHTTVLHSERRALSLIAEGDPTMRQHVRDILSVLGVDELPEVRPSPPTRTERLTEMAASIAAIECRLEALRAEFNQLQREGQ